jgi:hypothetical protein
MSVRDKFGDSPQKGLRGSLCIRLGLVLGGVLVVFMIFERS